MCPKNSHIPRATIERLAMYLEVLNTLAKDSIEIVSSESLANFCSANASQIRKDLAYFGEFGVRGVGYYVEALRYSIADCLGINREWRAVLMGVGNMGRSLLMHHEFRMRDYRIVGVFDPREDRKGLEIAGLIIYDPSQLKDMAADLKPDIGIITSHPKHVQTMVDSLVSAKVQGILNFAPTRIKVPDGIFVEYVDFLHHLYALSFNINCKLKRNKRCI